jgi:CheY-like chemotaxis protein
VAEFPAMTGTVLLVEDEELMRLVVEQLLAELGFTVLTAPDGVAAVERFRQHQSDIDCVLSDLTMPRMDGWETMAALRQLSPDIPVILSSGYDEAQVMAGCRAEPPQAFLNKPYQASQLNQTIRSVLNGRQAKPP